MTLFCKLNRFLISSGKCLYWTFIYSSPSIGVARKKSFRSADMKRAPFDASDMVLLMSSFVSSRFAAGDPASELYERQSPPTVIRILCGSVLRGL